MFRKIREYRRYCKFIKTNSFELNDKFKLRIDRANYLYTVININSKMSDNFYGEDQRLAKPFIDKYVKEFDEFLKLQKIDHLFAFRQAIRINDSNWKVDFSYAGFDTKKLIRNFIIGFIIGIIGSLIYFL